MEKDISSTGTRTPTLLVKTVASFYTDCAIPARTEGTNGVFFFDILLIWRREDNIFPKCRDFRKLGQL
jgi:hypothetical protein